MRRSLAAAFAFGLASTQALAAGMTVPMDEVRTVTFGKPVATVYVGNSVIADVNMIDSRHAFVLGKAFGTTNVIALDQYGPRDLQHLRQRLGHPRRDGDGVPRLAQTTLSCGGPRCEVSPMPGRREIQGRPGRRGGASRPGHQDRVTAYLAGNVTQ